MNHLVQKKFTLLLVCLVLILCQCMVISPLFAQAENDEEDQPQQAVYEPMQATLAEDAILYAKSSVDAEVLRTLDKASQVTLLSAYLEDNQLWYEADYSYITEEDVTETVRGYLQAVCLVDSAIQAEIGLQEPIYKKPGVEIDTTTALYSETETVEILTTSLLDDTVWCQILFTPKTEITEEALEEAPEKELGYVEASLLTFKENDDVKASGSVKATAPSASSSDSFETPEQMEPSAIPSGEIIVESVPSKMTLFAAAVDPFEENLKNFPISYHAALRELHSKYPNWTFTAKKTAMSWPTQLSRQLAGGTSLIWKTASDPYVDLSDKDANGNQETYDGGSWYKASEAAVRYYLDPRNFLTEDYIFMFESLNFNSAHTVAGVQAALSGSFATAHAQAIYDAGKNNDVNAYYLAARIRLEQGANGNGLAHGTVIGTFDGDPNYFSDYFNFFNIGAYEATVNGQLLKPTQRGAWYARGSGTNATSYGRPWTTAEKSINGGTAFVKSGYIDAEQNTSYSQKFNTVGSSSHQYMTNVQAPATEATKTKNAYPTLNVAVNFIIPVYDDMPDSPGPKPGTNVITPVHTITWALSAGYIHNVNIGTTAGTILEKTTVSNGTSGLYSQTGIKLASTDKVGTGHSFRVYDSAWAQRACYYIVIYGDLTSDGDITTADLVASRKHLLGTAKVSGAYLKAGDINKDGGLTMADHIAIRKHLLGMQNITQQ